MRLLQIRDFESDEYQSFVSKENNLRYVDADDVLLARYGASVGKILRGKNGVINVALMRAMPNEAILSKSFLYYFLQIQRVQDYLTGLGGRSAQAGFNQGELNRIEISVPCHDEQVAIVSVLDRLKQQVSKCKDELALERERKSALMEHLFTHGNRGEPTKQTQLGEIPESWKVVELGEVARIGNGSTPKRSDERYWKAGTIPWITSTQIHDMVIQRANELVTETARKECHLPLVPKGSVVVAITGQGKTLGNAALLAIDTCVNQHLAYIQFERSSLKAEFALAYLQSKYGYLRGIASGGGSTKGALTCGFLKTMSIPVPSLDEQSTISGLLLACDKKCRCLARELAILEEIFKAVLEELMTGRLSATSLIEEHQPQ